MALFPADRKVPGHALGFGVQVRLDAMRLELSFLSYTLHVTLKTRLKQSAGGLTPKSALEKLATMQMLDVFLIRSPQLTPPFGAAYRLSI